MDIKKKQPPLWRLQMKIVLCIRGYSSLPRVISPCCDFIPVVQDFRLPISHLIGEKVFVLRAVIIVKRILKPEVSSVIPEADQNISSEIFFHIILANFKIAVQENAVLDFTQFVKISDNCNSFIMFHCQIVLMCFIFCFAAKFYPSLKLTVQRWGNKKPRATFLAQGHKNNYLTI